MILIHYDSKSRITGMPPLCAGQETIKQSFGSREFQALTGVARRVTCPDCKDLMEERRGNDT